MEYALRIDRLRLVTGILVWTLLGPSITASAGQIHLPDLENKLVDPFHAPAGVKAIVFLFTGTDCPISNRSAPEVRRLYERFAAKGVVFWLVYPNPGDSLESIRDHVEAYGYPTRALRDPQHALVKLAKVSVTPEAAVFNVGGRIVYRGRIDDRYVDFGVQRPAPTRRDLADALTAVLAGKPVLQPTTQAVGCFIADFLR